MGTSRPDGQRPEGRGGSTERAEGVAHARRLCLFALKPAAVYGRRSSTQAPLRGAHSPEIFGRASLTSPEILSAVALRVAFRPSP